MKVAGDVGFKNIILRAVFAVLQSQMFFNRYYTYLMSRYPQYEDLH
jgi:hypothetical protein